MQRAQGPFSNISNPGYNPRSAALLVAAAMAAATSATAPPAARAGRAIVVVGAADVTLVAAARPVLAPAATRLVVFVPGVPTLALVRMSLAEIVHRLFVVLVS